MVPHLANESELFFERGGPTYQLLRRIGVIRGDDPSVRRRIVVFIAITWVPLLILSILEGHAIGPTPRESLLLDFATYARFFVGLPFLFVAELTVGPRLSAAARHFLQAGFIRPDEYPLFDRAVARLVRWRESVFAELVIASLALLSAWTVSPDMLYKGEAGSTATWIAVETASGARLFLAGYWYKFVAVAVLQFFLLRWMWRLIIWTRFLGAVAQLNLALVPTHADQAGGLGFLGTTHLSLGIFPFGFSSVLSADAAFRIVFEHASIESFKGVALVVLAATEVICLGPTLVFAPIMMRQRLAALREYSLLVVRYNRAFHEKWIDGKLPADDSLLGTSDIQSLADLGSSFDYIRQMRFATFNVRIMMQLALIAALPALPLLPLVMPWQEILRICAGALL